MNIKQKLLAEFDEKFDSRLWYEFEDGGELYPPSGVVELHDFITYVIDSTLEEVEKRLPKERKISQQYSSSGTVSYWTTGDEWNAYRNEVISLLKDMKDEP